MKDSLREQKKFSDNLIDISAVATFVLDAQHKIVLWNKACEELTGFRDAEMIGTDDQWKPFYDHKRPCIADIIIGAKRKPHSFLPTRTSSTTPRLRN